MADLQRKSYHTPRFYQPFETIKSEIIGTPWEEIYNKITNKYEIKEAYVELNCAVFWVDKKDLFEILKQLKNIGYETLSEMSAIDKIEEDENCFEMFYQLHSMLPNFKDKRRLRVKCRIKENENLDSVSSLFKLAIWSERETYDMFGIKFVNHPALTRLIMPKDWVGHPLRRCYPLQGDEYASWYEVDKIFGEEYREIIGKEQRDSARVDEDDINFSKIAPLGQEAEPLYIEASKALFVKNLTSKKKELLTKRK